MSERAPTQFPYGHLTDDAGASADPVLVEIVQGFEKVKCWQLVRFAPWSGGQFELHGGEVADIALIVGGWC